MRFPVREHVAEVIETAIERCDIDGSLRGSSMTGFEAQLSQTDAVKSLIFWESPHPLSIVRVNSASEAIPT